MRHSAPLEMLVTKKDMIGKVSQVEQNGAKFSFIAPSIEQLWLPTLATHLNNQCSSTYPIDACQNVFQFLPVLLLDLGAAVEWVGLGDTPLDRDRRTQHVRDSELVS